MHGVTNHKKQLRNLIGTCRKSGQIVCHLWYNIWSSAYNSVRPPTGYTYGGPGNEEGLELELTPALGTKWAHSLTLKDRPWISIRLVIMFCDLKSFSRGLYYECINKIVYVFVVWLWPPVICPAAWTTESTPACVPYLLKNKLGVQRVANWERISNVPLLGFANLCSNVGVIWTSSRLSSKSDCNCG